MRLPFDRIPPVATRAAAVLALVAALVLLARSDSLHGALIGLFAAARDIIAAHPVAGPVVFVILAAVSAMLGFFSSTVLIPAAVLAWGAISTMAMLWIGWLLGGVFAHTIAFRFGRPILRWFVSPAVLARYERMLERQPRFTTILLLQAALPSELVGYVLGLARYPLLRYIAALGIVQVPWAIGTVLLGVGFVERNTAMLVGVSLAGMLFLVIVARLALRRRVA
jgi:uncharacterized membrane protein YdjX (TVP38/TMEM64 family)